MSDILKATAKDIELTRLLTRDANKEPEGYLEMSDEDFKQVEQMIDLLEKPSKS